MGDLDIRRGLEVGDGSGHADDSVDGAPTEMETFGGDFQQIAGGGRKGDIATDRGPAQGAVQRTMWPASPLAGAGLHHALPHDGTRFPRLRGGQQLPGRLAGNTDLEVDSVADGPRNPIAVARPREW